ncbi:MAG: hypothetical protein P8M80_11205, partial [Pirellulaceae bacterium]|nr:hypothetical protein [Pirellulaceae bacterium]
NRCAAFEPKPCNPMLLSIRESRRFVPSWISLLNCLYFPIRQQIGYDGTVVVSQSVSESFP